MSFVEVLGKIKVPAIRTFSITGVTGDKEVITWETARKASHLSNGEIGVLSINLYGSTLWTWSYGAFNSSPFSSSLSISIFCIIPIGFLPMSSFYSEYSEQGTRNIILYGQIFYSQIILIEFSSNVVEEFKKTMKKTKTACAKFCRRVLFTYNRCQTFAEKRLEVLPKHELFLKHLQDIYKEDEQAIQ